MFTEYKPSRYTLPGGIEVYSPDYHLAEWTYQEQPQYFRYGIKLESDHVIFDVGANIGLFTVYVNNVLGKNVDVFAFEPIPSTYSVLRLNQETFCSPRTRIHNYGLGKQTETVKFYHSPVGHVLSSRYPGRFEELISIKAFRSYITTIPTGDREELLEKLQNPIELQCPIKKLSDVINEYGVTTIDLLKIDVEKSEFDVLLGIDPDDWPKIKQVVAEIHDFENHLKLTEALLKAQGFSQVIFKQERNFKGTDIYMLYATR